MLQMRRSGQRALQTTAQIRFQLNQRFYNIKLHNHDSAKQTALIMALFVYVMRLENKELENLIYDRLNLNELQLQQLALYKMRILAANSEEEVEQIQNEMVEEMGPLLDLDEDDLLELSKQFDPTVPEPLLSPLPPELARQTLCATGQYQTDMTVGEFHDHINDYVVVLNDNAIDEHEQGNQGKAVTIKKLNHNLRQAGDDVIRGHEAGNVNQVNNALEGIVRIENFLHAKFPQLKGIGRLESLESLLSRRVNNRYNDGPGVFNSYKSGNINVANIVNDLSNRNSAVAEGENQSSNFGFGSGNN